MIDPLEAVLWHLLENRTCVATTDLCSWDEQRAEYVMAQARMHQETPGWWAPTKSTRQWSRRVWDEIKMDPREMRGLPLHRKLTRARKAGLLGDNHVSR